MREGFAVILTVVRRNTLQFTLHADAGLGETAFNVGDGFFEKMDAIPEKKTHMCFSLIHGTHISPYCITWILYFQIKKTAACINFVPKIRIRLWPLRRDDSSSILIGAGGIWRSDWPEHV